MSMFKDIPVEVGVIYEGERIRRNDMQVELGGPTVKQKFELAKVKPMNEIEDGKITIIGPDIKRHERRRRISHSASSLKQQAQNSTQALKVSLKDASTAT